MDDKEVTQYYLRHTFATVCQQYVRPDIVDIWMGDSSERLVGRVYTHFSDDFMLKQMQNVIFDIWLHKRQEPLRRIIPVKRLFSIVLFYKSYTQFLPMLFLSFNTPKNSPIQPKITKLIE